jgi:DNA-binding NarL/FixJ family response regulator
MTPTITVSLIEDHARTRETLTKLIDATEGLRCISSYGSGEAALEKIPLDRPDVALVDINLPGMNGVECVAKLRQVMPSLRLLMLTTYEQSDVVFNALRAGASGYLLKNLPPEELTEALKAVYAGGAPMSMQVARKVVEFFHQPAKPESDLDVLTQREREVLALLANGLRYKEIASQLNVSLNTVRTHATHIYEKLHVQSRTEATVKFLKQE